jgi:hypothetical protein
MITRVARCLLAITTSLILTTTTLVAANDPLCQTGNRYADLGNGTVQDCATGLLWLKNASCESLGPVKWDKAITNVASLADGSCGHTDGSSAGDWRLPEIGELCNTGEAPVVEEICPAGAASTSLINSAFPYPGPAVSNTAGTGIWKKNDPFVGVLSSSYWSGTKAGTLGAWGVNSSIGVQFIRRDYYYRVWPVRALP